MLSRFSITVIAFLLLFLTSSCSQQPVTDSDADDAVLEVMRNANCNCLAAFTKRALTEELAASRPKQNIDRALVRILGLQNQAELHRLITNSKNYRPDYARFRKQGFTIVSRKELLEARNKGFIELLRKCPKGVQMLSNPIFNPSRTRCLVQDDAAFDCFDGPILLLRKKEGHWVMESTNSINK